MFNVNEVVLYGNQGVCRISEITQKDFGGNLETYYILKPVQQTNSTLFVPVKNEKLIAKMHKLLSADEITKMIKSISTLEDEWISKDSDRKIAYQTALNECNREQILRAIVALHKHKKAKIEKGKKLHYNDESILKDMERIMFDEISFVLEMELYKVPAFITSEMYKN